LHFGSDSFKGVSTPGSPNAYGLALPRIPRISVAAWKKGWRPASARLQVPKEVGEIEVRLVLTPGLAIEGVVRDENGAPIPEVEVDVFVVRWFPFTGLDQISEEASRRHSPNGGVGIAGPINGKVRVRVQERAFTDSNGRFTVYTKSEGRIGVYIHAPGREPGRADLGETSDNVSGLSFSLRMARAEDRIQVLDGFSPLANENIAVLDMSDPIEPCLTFTTDRSGCFPASWLQTDHEYFVQRLRKPLTMGYLTFKGQSSFDCALLKKKL
jgi:hypothetical protein